MAGGKWAVLVSVIRFLCKAKKEYEEHFGVGGPEQEIADNVQPEIWLSREIK